MANIKRGDAYLVPIALTLDGEPLTLDGVDLVEIIVGSLRKTYPGDVLWDEEAGKFLFPVEQAETFAMKTSVAYDVRVKFSGGVVIGLPNPGLVNIGNALSREVL